MCNIYHLDTLDQRESVLDISHIAHLSVRYKNIAHLFLLKHSKITSHIFDDAWYFFDDAKECCSNLNWSLSIFIVKDNGFDCGFWIYCVSYDFVICWPDHQLSITYIMDLVRFDCGFWIWCSCDIIICKLILQLNLKDYIYSVGCEVWLWILDDVCMMIF